MSQLATKQLNLLVSLSEGQVFPRAMLPKTGGIYARLLQLGASLCGYLGSNFKPSMAILGKQLAWGGGGIATIVPSLGVLDFLGELFHGRPVIFVNGRKNNPYSTLSNVLRFDVAETLTVLLNGNGWLAVAGRHSGKKVIAHVGADEEGLDALARHQRGLSLARAALMETSLLYAIPAPVSAYQDHDVSVFIQTHLAGKKLETEKVSTSEFAVHLLKSANPLIDIHKATFSSEAPEQQLLSRMESECPNIAIDQVSIDFVASLIADTRRWLIGRCPGAVQVHGDYTLSNVLFDGHGDVSAILDWEWTRERGCAGFDLVFLGIAAAAEKLAIDQTTLAADIAQSRDIPTELRKYFVEILPQFDLNIADLVPLARLVWLNIIFRSSVWTPPPYDDWLVRAIAVMRGSVRDTQ
jgi:hypothetical protein